MRTIIIIIFMFMSACGDESTKHGPKDLFSLWTNETKQLDLSGLGFGVRSVFMNSPENPTIYCTCDVDILGTQSEGTATVSNCDNGMGSNNGCYNEATYDYYKSSWQLEVCLGTNCEVYE